MHIHTNIIKQHLHIKHHNSTDSNSQKQVGKHDGNTANSNTANSEQLKHTTYDANTNSHGPRMIEPDKASTNPAHAEATNCLKAREPGSTLEANMMKPEYVFNQIEKIIKYNQNKEKNISYWETKEEKEKTNIIKINSNEEDKNIKLWNNTMEKYVIASKTHPLNLTHTLLFSLIQTGQIEINNEYSNTKFNSLSLEEETFVNMCRQVTNIFDTNNKKNETTKTAWILEKASGKKL